MRILLVEDEATIAEGIRSLLAHEGFAVDAVADGDAALDWAGTYDYDLVILDIVLPGIDGYAVCSALRSRGHEAPILMLTALDQVDRRVEGLNRGADDYLVKPFAVQELLARVRALLRRRGPTREPVIRLDDLEIDPAAHEVRRGGRPARLTAREFAVLEVLARHPNQLLSRQRLLDAVWAADFLPESNIVDVYIRSLRRKIDGGSRSGMIETVRGVGYRLKVRAAS